MKIIYIIRVAFFSLEFLILLFMIGAIFKYSSQIEFFVVKLNLNEEFKKFLILLPVSLFAWIIKEARDLAFLDAEFTKMLVNWPDYGKLKIHIYVSIAYAALFFLLAAIPWISKIELSTGAGAIMFFGSVLGSFAIAGSIYFAQISMKEFFRIEHNNR